MQQAQDIWFNGIVETMDPENRSASAIAVCDGRILAVGSDEDILNLAGPGTRHHNLDRQFIMPGLVESHTHALWGASRDLFDVFVGFKSNLEELLAATAERARQLPRGAVVYGGPWTLEMRAQMGPNPKELLDRISIDHPIVLNDSSMHMVWCNSRALADAGIAAASPDIKGGVIERTSSGAPNGILTESATAPIREKIVRSPEELAEATKYLTRYFNGLGITAFKEPMAFETDLMAYKAADDAGILSVHMAAHIAHQSPSSNERIPFEAMERLRSAYASENIRTGFAKLFLDGVGPAHTASFTEPYLASSGYDVANHDADGLLVWSPEELGQTVSELDKRGFVVKMHAVGDNAVRRGLDAIEVARDRNGDSGLRHEIAHCSFVRDQDLGRFKKLQAIAEISPKLWFPNSVTPAQRAVLGPERAERINPVGSLLKAGAELIYGSDWPAAAPDADPWSGLAGLLTRQNCNPEYPGILAPDQAIGLRDALQMMTVNGARALGIGSETGRLMAGMWADFIVLAKPLSEIPALETGHVAVRQTVWKGKTVHAV